MQLNITLQLEMIADTYLQTSLWGKKLIMNELEIKLNCLYKLMEELNIQKRYNDAATVYWAIAQLESYFKVKVK